MKAWVTLPFKCLKRETEDDRDQRVDDVLRAWYHKKQPHPSQDGNLNFDENIVPFCLGNDDDQYQWFHPLRDVNPYEDRLFLFYRIRPIAYKIDIVGTMAADTLVHKLRGHITLGDMTQTRVLTRVDEPKSPPLPTILSPLSIFPIIAEKSAMRRFGSPMTGIHASFRSRGRQIRSKLLFGRVFELRNRKYVR